MSAPCNSLETLSRYVAMNLPDSLSQRKAVLLALGKVLKPNQPVYRHVQANLAALRAVEQLQAKLHAHLVSVIQNRLQP